MIRSLLVCDDFPSVRYGTGQRLLSLQTALSALGDCRILHLSNNADEANADADFTAPMPFDYRASRWAWTKRYLTFAETRHDRRYRRIFEQIRSEYPFDLIFCSFFRNTPAIPTDLAPSFLDLDAIPDRTGLLTRTIWPLTLRMMRRRARDFRALYVIRPSDADLFAGCASSVSVLPGISASAPAQPVRSNPEARHVLFVAPTSWPPNREAIEWLLALGVPDALHEQGYELRLIGAGTDSFPERPGLSCGGFVDDLAAEYAAARLVLCPIWTGGGANIKLAEAIQFGRPVLATAHSAEGFDGLLKPGDDLVTFDRGDDFLAVLQGLLSNSPRLRTLEDNATRAASRVLNQEYINGLIAEDVRAVCA